MSDGKDAGFYIELQSTGSRDFKRVVLRPPRTTYFPGAFFMRRYLFLMSLLPAFLQFHFFRCGWITGSKKNMWCWRHVPDCRLVGLEL